MQITIKTLRNVGVAFGTNIEFILYQNVQIDQTSHENPEFSFDTYYLPQSLAKVGHGSKLEGYVISLDGEHHRVFLTNQIEERTKKPLGKIYAVREDAIHKFFFLKRT